MALAAAVGLGVRTLGNADEDVAGLDLLGNLVVGEVRVVVKLGVGVRDLRLAAGQLVGVKGEVFEFAGLADGGLVAQQVLLEEGLEVAVGGVEGLAEIVRVDDGVVEFDLGSADPVGVAYVIVGDGDAAGDERLQAAELYILFHFLFKVGAGFLELRRDEVHVGVVADKLAVGKEDLAELSLMQKMTHIVVGRLQSAAVTLDLEHRELNELLAGLVFEVWQQVWRNLTALHLLLHETLRRARELLLRDRLGVAEVARKGAWLMHRAVSRRVLTRADVIEDARNERDDHGQDCEPDDDGEDDLDELVVLLQNANHA